MHRWLWALALTGALAMACGGDDGGSRSYPSDFDDDELDLEAMAVREDDMPERGIERQVGDTFDNEEWAVAFATQHAEADPEQKRIQFDAQGRVRGYTTLFTWDSPIENLGKIQQIESHSTIYEDEDSASNAMRFHACGLLIGDDEQLDPFEVPNLASESTGFFHQETLQVAQNVNWTFVDTVVCFRTGRVLHAVVQNGLDGTQRQEDSIDLARRMLSYVNDVFDGRTPESEDEPAG